MSLSAITGNYSNFFPPSLLSKVQEPKPNCDTHWAQAGWHQPSHLAVSTRHSHEITRIKTALRKNRIGTFLYIIIVGPTTPVQLLLSSKLQHAVLLQPLPRGLQGRRGAQEESSEGPDWSICENWNSSQSQSSTNSQKENRRQAEAERTTGRK